MKKMKNLFIIRSSSIDPDPRVEKEADVLRLLFRTTLVAWNRDVNGKTIKSNHIINDYTFDLYKIGVKASIGGGFKKNLFPLIRYQFKLFLFLFKNRKQIDIIHACDFDTAFVSFYFSKIFKKIIVYDIFDYYVDSFSVPRLLRGIIKTIDGFVIRHSNAVIICNESRIHQLGKYIPKQLKIIHNSPSFSMVKFDEKIEKTLNQKIKIVYVGILGEGRFLIEIANALSYRDDIEFHIGGFGPLEKELIDITNRSKSIKFHGKLDYNTTINLENRCHIITAIYDPKIRNHKFASPNKFYESLMLGKPIIAIKNTGIDEIIMKNKLGIVCDFNIESVIQGINRLVDSKDKWPEIESVAKQLYADLYSWDIMKKRLLNLYQQYS